MNMCPRLVEISSVTSDIRRREERKKKTAAKYNPFGIAMPWANTDVYYRNIRTLNISVSID